MRIIIMLVAFLLGGSLLAITFLSQRFDIGIGLLFIITISPLLVIIGIVTIMDNSKRANIKETARKSRIDKEKKQQKKVSNSKKVLDDSNIACDSVDTIEKGIIKYRIKPNTDNVWNALCDYIIYHGETTFSFKRIQRDLKSVKITHVNKDEEISLNRNEKGIFLVLKNIEKPPYFV